MGEMEDILAILDWLEKEKRKDDRPFLQLPIPGSKYPPEDKTKEGEVAKPTVITFDF